MLSINTNISSIVAQHNMTSSTNKLNQAIERLTTGYKINHAGDNAANYSISTDMNVQLSSYDIAADNIAMGMDLLSTAQDTIAGMQERGSRIHALITQARNGTYGATSLSALSTEAQALVSEINRLYINTEYNGKKLLEISLPDWAKTVGTIDGKSLEACAAEHNGFIDEVVCDIPDIIVTDPNQLASAISSNTKIGIGDARTLAKLAELVNAGTHCSGKTIILTEDVDLSAICAENTDGAGNGGWTPIGTSSKVFGGIFNGNGHKVTGLYIKREGTDYQGLFGFAAGELKNIGVEGVNVTGKNQTGGLVGQASCNVTNCYATGSVTGKGICAGGLVGAAYYLITNCYSAAAVKGPNGVGGLAGYTNSTITNSYATGNVTGGSQAGGLAGSAGSSISNSYATGNVSGEMRIGGLIGEASGTITNSYATGNVSGGKWTGGLIGEGSGSITNSYATGKVSGGEFTGGLIGVYNYTSGTVTDNNILADGTVTGRSKVGNLIGGIVNTSNGSSFSTINITNAFARSGGDMIGFEGNSSGTAYSSGQMDTWLENIQAMNLNTTLQVGINGDSDSRITVGTAFSFDLDVSDLTSDSAYNSITNFLNQLSQKSTEIGAAQNRLESALESTMVSMDNLTSSLSTIRDADIAQVSSDYIRQQILQQAAATLMSTANQSPSIALQLI